MLRCDDSIIIKRKLCSFIEMWKSKEINELENIFDYSVRAYFNISKAGGDGGQHSLFGLRDFILDFPKIDYLQTTISDYICRVKGESAVQYAIVKCVASDNQKNRFQCLMMMLIRWKVYDGIWKICEIRLDVNQASGNLIPLFQEVWALDGRNQSCILAELDSPWSLIPTIEDSLTEEEEIRACISKFNFGVAHVSLELLDEAIIDYRSKSDKKLFINYIMEKRRLIYGQWPLYKLIELNISNQRAQGVLECLTDSDRKNSAMFKKEDGSWKIADIFGVDRSGVNGK